MFDCTPASSEPCILPEHTPGGPDHPHPVYVPLLPDPEGLPQGPRLRGSSG